LELDLRTLDQESLTQLRDVCEELKGTEILFLDLYLACEMEVYARKRQEPSKLFKPSFGLTTDVGLFLTFIRLFLCFGKFAMAGKLELMWLCKALMDCVSDEFERRTGRKINRRDPITIQ